MSLLGDLRLDFETLEDDPIDKGIYYGKSVLQAFSDRIIQPLSTTMGDMVMDTKPLPALAKEGTAAYYPRRLAAMKPTYTPRTTSFDRRNFRRDFSSVTARTYANRREMVGSL